MFNYNMSLRGLVIVMGKDSFPGPGDLEKELNDYLTKKYGNRIRLSVPFMSPEHAVIQKDVKDNIKEKTSEKFNFNLKPEELEAYLDEYVIKQEKAKEILATKMCTHFNRIKCQDRASSTEDSSATESCGTFSDSGLLCKYSG